MNTAVEKTQSLPDIPGVVRASSLEHESAELEWTCAALTGQLVELSGAEAPATMTAAVRLVRDAQTHAEPVAWITTEATSFFPPDVAEHGVDLEALVVARVPDAQAVARAADALVRSGSFGLVVLDMGNEKKMPMPLQARLLKLAQKERTAVVCLTLKASDAQSLSSLISLRVEAKRVRKADGVYVCEVRTLKDKRRAERWAYRENCRGPLGLR